MKKRFLKNLKHKYVPKFLQKGLWIVLLPAFSGLLLLAPGCGGDFGSGSREQFLAADGPLREQAGFPAVTGEPIREQMDAPAVMGEPIEDTEGSAEYESSSLNGETLVEDANMIASNDRNVSEKENPRESAGTVLPAPGVRTLENFLRTALLPLGNTMYVWGGGWNEEDTGAGEEAVSLGVSPQWKTFADLQTKDYDYRQTRYQIHDGLDCSGYVGWTVYNTMETEDGGEGYVFKSTDTAELYAGFGWGDFSPASQVKDWLAGDIMSMKGHVWICLGTCEDGSVLLLHSSPPGVRLCGTPVPGDFSESVPASQAVSLAEEYLSARCPEWFQRFPDCRAKTAYLQDSGQMRWNKETFPDADEIRALTPEELLETLFSEPGSGSSSRPEEPQ